MLVYVSLVIDTGMLIQALIGIYMLARAFMPPCDELETRLLVSVICAATVLRVSHVVSMTLFFLCCFPCYFCNDSCFIKKRLINSGGLSRKGLILLENRWTWLFDPPVQTITKPKSTQKENKKKYSSPTHCPVCFLQLERGQRVTFLPCQIAKTILNQSNKLSLSQGG